MSKTIVLFIVLFCLPFFMHCSDDTVGSRPDDTPHLTPGDLTDADKQLIRADNTFGFKLFKEVIKKDKDKNVFISPLSVAMALGMAYNGADGTTREKMATTLELQGMTVEQVNQAYRNVIDVLTHLDDGVEFSIANSIWHRLGFAIESTFLAVNQTYFDAEVNAVNFTLPATVDSINGWVDEHTNGKITKIVSSPLSADIALMLIDAIYFKGNWSDKFNRDSTEDALFMLPDDSHVSCRMMMKHTTFLYAWQSQFQMISLPYGDSAFSMTLIFPADEVDIDTIINEFADATWNNWLARLAEQELTLGLPKFKLEYEISLVDILAQMGMDEAFAPGADFSNIIESHPLWIDDVKHKTFVEVNEEGTEAAAVTVVVFIDSIMQPLIINRPFVVVIHDNKTGTILFMGKVVDPS